MIFPQLNRYLAWSGRPDGKSIMKNIDGMSKPSPKWVQKYIEKIATSIITYPAREQILKGSLDHMNINKFEWISKEEEEEGCNFH